MLVYILSDYDEHGAENVVVTLDRSLLMLLVDSNWPTANEEWKVRAKEGLAELLARSDDELLRPAHGWDCHAGWGGMQLHVVKLQE